MTRGCAQLCIMVNSNAYYCSCWLYTIKEFLVTKLNSQYKTEILPKIKYSISMKIGYAQLHMMIHSCIIFHKCWVNSFLNSLLTKLNSHNLWFLHKTTEILPKNYFSIFINIYRCVLQSMCELHRFDGF